MSLWWLSLILVPFVLLPVVAFRRWPIYADIARLRLLADEGAQKDIDEVLRTAVKAEASGDWPRAKKLLELVARYRLADEETVSYVKERLEARNRLSGNLANPYRSPTV